MVEISGSESSIQTNQSGTIDPVSDSTVVASMDIAGQIKDKILSLQAALSSKLPNYEGLLHTIHVQLNKNPDVAHTLSDEEIGIIVAGLSKKTLVVIAAKEAKKKAGKMTVDDL